MPKITVVKKGPIRKSIIREIPCVMDDPHTTFTVVVANNSGSTTVSLEDMENRTLLPRQLELHEEEYLFWKEIFEVVLKAK